MMRRIADRIGYAETVAALLVSLGIIATGVYASILKVNQINNNTLEINQIKPMVYQTATDLLVLRTAEQNHQDEIVRRLSRIENKIDKQSP